VIVALLWLRFIDGIKLSNTDYAGAAITFVGMAIIIWGWKSP